MQELKIADFLQTLRKAHGYTQQEVADHLHISNKTISKWETGQALPDILSLKALAELYDVTVDEILNGQKDFKESPKKDKAINNLLTANVGKKLNFSLLISGIVFLIGLLIDLVLSSFNYDLVGFFINFFIVGIGIIIYFLPYILINKEDLEYATSTKLRNNNILTSIVGGSLLLSYLTLFAYQYLIFLAIIIGIGFSFIAYYALIKNPGSSKLIKAKIIILLLVCSINFYNIFFYLFAPLDNILTKELLGPIIYVTFIVLFIICIIVTIVRKFKSIIPSITTLIIGCRFIIFLYIVSDSSVFLVYYFANPTILVVLGLTLFIIDCILINYRRDNSATKCIQTKYLKHIIKGSNILASLLTITFGICYFFVPYINASPNVFVYYNLNTFYSILIFLALFVITLALLFIPIIKNLAPTILLFGVCIYTSYLFDGVSKSEAVFFVNFANYSGLASIILGVVLLLLIIAIQIIKLINRKRIANT